MILEVYEGKWSYPIVRYYLWSYLRWLRKPRKFCASASDLQARIENGITQIRPLGWYWQ